MNTVKNENKKGLMRVEFFFFIFSIWFLFSSVVVVGPLFYKLLSVSAKASSADPFRGEYALYNLMAVVMGLRGAGFSFMVSSLLRRILGLDQRYNWDTDKIVKYTCLLFVGAALLSMGAMIQTFGAFGFNFSPLIPIWMRLYQIVSSFIPQLFDILLAFAFYVFYKHFMGLKKFEEEVI